MKILLPVLIVFLFLTHSFLHSQQKWRLLTTEHGLSSNAVINIHQTENGDIWVATDQGIDLYNGIFQPFLSSGAGTRSPMSSTNLNPTPNSFVESASGQVIARIATRAANKIYLFDGLEWDEPDFFDDNDILVPDMPEFSVSSGGKLWMSTWEGLVGFDGQKWQLYDPDVRIGWLVKTPDGQLWTESWLMNGIFSFDGQKWNLEFNTNNTPFGNVSVNTVLSTSTGEILLGTDEGLFQYNPVLNLVTDLKLGEVNVTKLFEADDHTLWVGTDQGLYRLGEISHQLFMSNKFVTVIYQRPNGEIWLGTTSGLYLFSGNEWILKLTAGINCIAELTDGTLMVGGNSGLRMLRTEETSGNWKFQDNVGKLIVNVLKASDGTLWCISDAGISTYNGVNWTNHLPWDQPGIVDWKGLIYETKDGTVWFAYYSFKDRTPIRHEVGNSYYFVDETKDGDIWAGGALSGGGGPFLYDGNNWTLVDGYGGRANALVCPYKTYQASDGLVWAHGRDGLWSYDGTKWDKHLDGNGEAFFEDDDGTLWAGHGNIGSHGGPKSGIYRLGKDGKWTQSIQAGYIRMIEETSQGMLIAGDEAGGILIYDGNQWSKHPSYDDGSIYWNRWGKGFVEYPSGVFWLATNRGLKRIEGDSWYNLTVADGLPSNDVHTVEEDGLGNLWVGTDSGLVRFTPSLNRNSPAIQLTQVDEEDIPDDRIYTTGHSFVTLEWNAGDLETNNDLLQSQYSLDGTWSELLKQKTVTIGLANGEHQFSVRAIDHHFNTSSVDSITIIVKTEAPDPNIDFPLSGEILRGKIYIKGDIIDNDFAAYQVFITEVSRDKAPNLETEKALFQAAALPRTTTLAIWETEDLADKDYKIWLLAQDELEHKNSDEVIVRLDNTSPTVDILAPKDNQRVLKQVTISAVSSDLHLDNYRLDYSTNLTANEWLQIYVKGDLYQKDEIGLLKPPDLKPVEIQQEWEVPVKEGLVWIRLLATDIAGNINSQTIQVEVPTAVVTRKGGTITPENQQAELYFPPNTLAQDTIATVNAVTEVEVEPPVRRISQVYDFAPTTLRLNVIKPATLTISYDPSQLSAGNEPVIFHRTDGPWKAIGGTPNLQQQTISAAVLSLGQYTLGEMDKVEALDSANLKPDSLTCQPRVFSPKGNAFSTHTTISFTLDQPAQVTIKVYSVAGQLVEWLAQQQTFGSGKQAIRWSGRNSSGEIVASGLYIVTVTVGDQTQDKVVNIWNH
ncbi:MAG: two-component regulator propeller domain-containing protein [Candidatus Poribacteria bacterium]|nr:two-component regulator propeller domain-containing protein [Candidatus Poribacteria bacterium]